MFQNDKGNDAALLKNVNDKIMRGGGGSKSKITATVQRGTVTLSGNLQYDAQRAPLMKSVQCIAGVRRVVDLLRVPPRVNQYAAAEARAEASAVAHKAEKDKQAAADAAVLADTVLDEPMADEATAAVE